MDFRPDPELAVFRTTVRDFLTRNLPAELAHVPRGISSARRELTAWQAILNRQGWGAPGWAKVDGGTGWTVEQRVVFDEECALAGAPGRGWLCPKAARASPQSLRHTAAESRRRSPDPGW